MQRYMFRSGEFIRKIFDRSILEDMTLGFKMLKRGRMPLWPERIKGRTEVKKLIREEE